MFDDYVFQTGAANTSTEHFNRYAEDLTRRFGLTGKDLVVDIGSNDGTLLKAFRTYGTRILGIEPAANIARLANANGVRTLSEYFGPDTVDRIGRGVAQLITANNVVTHVNDLDGFIKTVSAALAPHGIFSFEAPWVVDVLKNRSFDIVYHEHLSYFGLRSLSKVLEKHDLELIDVEHFPDIHGGSLRGLVAHKGKFRKNSEGLRSIFSTEDAMANLAGLERLARYVSAFRVKLTTMLRELKMTGKRVVGYGAPAKATILLNYCSIDKSILDFVSDSTPLKQGKFIPGVRIPIVRPEEFRRVKPDYALLLAWNYKDEIFAKERDYLKSGGKFILPFPEPAIMG
jgi:novobiocin biosynthesis protein NovU/D-mycarose 3-C-methyltransferase